MSCGFAGLDGERISPVTTMERNLIKLDTPKGGNLETAKATEEQVARVAIKTAVGLRRSMSKFGIRQIADFVNGMVFAGILLQKNYDGAGDRASFATVLSRNAKRYRKMLEDEIYKGDLEELRQHKMGLTDQSPTDMMITAGLSAENTISELSRDYNFDATQALEMAAIVVVAAVVARGDIDDKCLEDLVDSVVEKAEIWDSRVPSDEEMFGDFED